MVVTKVEMELVLENIIYYSKERVEVKSMNLEELFKNLGKVGAKLFFNKEEKTSEKINLNQINSTNILPILLKRLVYEGEYNKAENILFNELNSNSSDEIRKIAIDFYNLLLQKSDEELNSRNFSRQEIYQGLEDIKAATCK